MQLLRKSQSGKSKTKREAFFVRIPTPDGKATFANATEHVGQPMPYKKPQATCAMRVTDTAVVFSFLQLSKKSVKNIADQPIELPRGPLAKLERKSKKLDDLPLDKVIIEIAKPRPKKSDSPSSNDAASEAAPAPPADGTTPQPTPAPVPDEPQVTATVLPSPASAEASNGSANKNTDSQSLRYELSLTRDENGTAVLEMEDDEPYDLPYGAVRASLYLRSPSVGRVVAVTFIGYPGRPGAPETVTRLASMILFSMSQLTEFRILSGIETVTVPAPPTAWAKKPVVRSADDQVHFVVPVWLFSNELAPVASGEVTVEVDLENANPTSDRLLFHFHPDEALADAFEHYRQVFEMSISEYLRLHLGDDEIASITYDIVLNAVDSGTLERLREAAGTVPGLDLTPVQKRPHA